MFATIHTISAPDTLWGKLKYNLLPPPVQAQVIPTEEGSGFLKLTVPIIRGKIYWSNVRAAAGDAAGNLLLPGNVHAQEPVNLRVFKSERFPALLCINSFFKLLSLLPQKQLLAECAVIDMSATFARQMFPLPRYARTIKIITANPEKYEAFSRHCMEEYGAAVLISEHISKAFDSPLVLYPQRAQIPTAFSRNSMIFAGCSDNLYTSHLFTPEGVALPARYIELMPPGISPLSFAAALYEVSGVSSLSTACSPAFRQNNLIFSYKDVISLLD